MPGGPQIHVSGGREQTEPPSGSVPKRLSLFREIQTQNILLHLIFSMLFFFFFPSTCFEWILLFKIYFFLGVSLHFNSFYSFTMFAFASLPRDIIPFP